MTVRIDSAAPPTTTAGLAPVPTAPRPPPPPTPRAQYPVAGLPPERRAEAHAANLALREQDVRDYARYVDAFVAEFKRCRTPAEAKAFGDLALPPQGIPPGSTDAERSDYKGRYAGGVNDWGLAAYTSGERRLSEHRLMLRGVKVPLSVDASVSGAVVCSPVGLKHRAVASTDASDARGPARELALGPVTVTRREGRPDRLEIDATPGSLAGVTVATDRRSVTVCVRAGKTFGPEGGAQVGAEAKACATLHLMSPEVLEGLKW